jgi:hypothetical protein
MLDQQIELILNSYFGGKYRKTGTYYNFKCNVCGDSDTDKRKKRAYILTKKDPYVFYCHNCNTSTTVVNWLKEYFPMFFREYIATIMTATKKQQPIRPPLKEVEDFYDEKSDVKYFIPIKNGIGGKFDIALKYCRDRLIPEEVYSKWFVAMGGTFINRLIIPYYDKDKKIYNWQARSLEKNCHNKYIFRKGNRNNIYGLDFVDLSRPVMIFEGVIDSLMVENSIAISGAGRAFDDSLKVIPKRYYVMDSDKKGREIATKLLERGEWVFVWKEFIKDFGLPKFKSKMDMNEAMILLKRDKKFTFGELDKYFINSIYRKLDLEA